MELIYIKSVLSPLHFQCLYHHIEFLKILLLLHQLLEYPLHFHDCLLFCALLSFKPLVFFLPGQQLVKGWSFPPIFRKKAVNEVDEVWSDFSSFFLCFLFNFLPKLFVVLQKKCMLLASNFIEGVLLRPQNEKDYPQSIDVVLDKSEFLTSSDFRCSVLFGAEARVF